MKLKHLLALCTALACGGTAEGFDDATGDLQEYMTAKVSQINSWRYGHLYAGAPCPYLSSPNQICYVPENKHVWIWITDTLPAIDRNMWTGAFAVAISTLQSSGQTAGFDFSFAQSANANPLTLGVYFSIALPGPGNLIQSYYLVDSPMTTVLTESLAGAWEASRYSDMYLDMAKFHQNDCSGTCQSLLATQIAGAALTNLMGLGYQTADTTSFTSHAVTAFAKTKGMTNTQKCLVDSFNTSSATTWSYSGNCN